MNLLDTLIEIELKEEDDFLKVKETLTRIGVASKKDKTLYQSCHILHKQGRYYLMHFKELFSLDGKETDFSDDDLARRNTIALLLEEWGLIKILNPAVATTKAPLNSIKILPFNQKKEWVLLAKYSIGKKLP